jgi:poly(3-hydroxybutyrate) depolymerase
MRSDKFASNTLIFTAALTLLLSNRLTADQSSLAVGIGSFPVSFHKQGKSQTLPVWYYSPPSRSPESRIVIVLHGMDRNADDYLSDWIFMADQQSWLIVVPVFSTRLFPGCEYRLGNMRGLNGRRRSRSDWSFALIERAFDEVLQRSKSSQENYTLFGHSAGAQFVHRMVLFQRDARFELAIAANAGYYTMPHRSANFPFGLGTLRYSESQLKVALARPLVVMLGDTDTEIDSSDVRTPLGQQGEHRFARGQRFLEIASHAAISMRVPLTWQIEIVPNVGHDHSAMAAAAGELILQHKETL